MFILWLCVFFSANLRHHNNDFPFLFFSFMVNWRFSHEIFPIIFFLWQGDARVKSDIYLWFWPKSLIWQWYGDQILFFLLPTFLYWFQPQLSWEPGHICTVQTFLIKKSKFREKDQIFTVVYLCLNPIELVCKLKLGSKWYNLQTNKKRKINL